MIMLCCVVVIMLCIGVGQVCNILSFIYDEKELHNDIIFPLYRLRASSVYDRF